VTLTAQTPDTRQLRTIDQYSIAHLTDGRQVCNGLVLQHCIALQAKQQQTQLIQNLFCAVMSHCPFACLQEQMGAGVD